MQALAQIRATGGSLAMAALSGFLWEWFMPLLFFVSGASAWFALRRRSAGQFARERVRKLAVPALFGIVAIVPLLTYCRAVVCHAVRSGGGDGARGAGRGMMTRDPPGGREGGPGMAWSANDTPQQGGAVAVVTGANSGIGLEAVREFARSGATVVMAVRNLDKGRAARDEVAAEIPGAQLQLQELDLSSLASVRAAASAIRAAHERIDLLVNNAGIMATPPRETADGFEAQVGTNHLGHFLLTQALMPALDGSEAARVVTLTSFAKERGRPLTEEALRLNERYDPWQAYADSKRANFDFALELARRLEAAGSHVAGLAAHPGLAHTNLQVATVENAGAGFQGRLWQFLARVLGMPAPRGALPTLRAATDPAARNGEFYGPRWLATGAPVRLAVRDNDERRAAGERLWTLSEAATGTEFRPGG